jgi:hypothetical protein
VIVTPREERGRLSEGGFGSGMGVCRRTVVVHITFPSPNRSVPAAQVTSPSPLHSHRLNSPSSPPSPVVTLPSLFHPPPKSPLVRQAPAKPATLLLPSAPSPLRAADWLERGPDRPTRDAVIGG